MSDWTREGWNLNCSTVDDPPLMVFDLSKEEAFHTAEKMVAFRLVLGWECEVLVIAPDGTTSAKCEPMDGAPGWTVNEDVDKPLEQAVPARPKRVRG